MSKLRIKSGDTIKVISGENKGKTGKVIQVIREKNRVLIEGVNMIRRHTKPSATSPQGGIIEKEAPIHISNVMLVDPKTGESTKVGRRPNENGKLVRYSKKTNEVIN